MDKQLSTDQSTSSNIFLTGVMLFANMDFTGYLDYAVKALIGGAIWLGYKITAERMDKKKLDR